jgi:peptide/nickel transport system ATP-binding protein
MSKTRLAIEGLTAVSRNPDRPVLRAISLKVAVAQVHGIVGESGAGKSTIAKAILGIVPGQIQLTDGKILFDGLDLLQLPPARRRDILGRDIALIAQDPSSALNPSRRIGAQLTDGLRRKRNLPLHDALSRAQSMLEEVQIRNAGDVLQSYPHQLSGGMRQRVLIAAAFVLEPKLVIADEPTTALDVSVQKQILRLIRTLQERHGTSVLFVSHDLGVVANICDSVSVLFMGKVMEQGATADILGDPQHAYTQALLAANPRYDRPELGLKPIPSDTILALQAEIDAFDRRPAG